MHACGPSFFGPDGGGQPGAFGFDLLVLQFLTF